MLKEKNNNQIKLLITKNFGPMLSYLYLMAIEFASDGLFVPSINPPENNIYEPANSFFNKEHVLSYKKTVRFLASEKNITLTFETIEDADLFFEEIERTW